MGSDLWILLFAVFLLAANAFFVAVEFALISSRRDRLDSMIAAGNRRATKVLYATEHLTIMLAGAQFGITIASLLLGKVGEPAIAHLIEVPMKAVGIPEQLLHPIAFAIALLLVTVLHIILGEMVPKNIALAGPETVATFLVGTHLMFCRITHPIMVVLNWVARVTLHVFGVEQRDELESRVSADELASMIQESRVEGLIAPAEAARLNKALGSSRRTLEEVLIPFGEVRSIPVASQNAGSSTRPSVTVAAVEEAVSETGFSRFPVVDNSGKWVGYIHIKDVLDNLVSGDSLADSYQLDPADIRPLITVEAGENFDLAMRSMRRSSSHIAAVVDKTGSIIGMITLEDIIEELVGTVRDWTHDE